MIENFANGERVITSYGEYEIQNFSNGYEKIAPKHFKVINGEDVPTTIYGFNGFWLLAQNKPIELPNFQPVDGSGNDLQGDN